MATINVRKIREVVDGKKPLFGMSVFIQGGQTNSISRKHISVTSCKII